MSDVHSEVGSVVMFAGNVGRTWSDDQLVENAKFVRTLGVDTLAVKLYNGTEKYYGDAAHLQHLKERVNHEAQCGLLAWGYHYGPVIGLKQCQNEAAIAKEVKDTLGSVGCDLEAEFNDVPGRAVDPVKAAGILADTLSSTSGFVYLTSWANPNQQFWNGVIAALNHGVSAWVPQEYDDFLTSQEYQYINLGAQVIQPAYDLSQEFGPNNVIDNAKRARARGHNTIWLWEIGLARNNPALVRNVINAFKATVSAPVSTQKTYVVQPKDTLSSIAAHLDYPSWQQLYQENQDTIERVARSHGEPDSDHGNLIYPDTVLEYR